MTVLLTGGRAPVALELARVLHRAGHRVVMAESLRYPLTFPSRAIVRHSHMPPPNRDLPGYLAALVACIQHESVDLLIPTCEEVFHIARGYETLAAHCAVFTLPIARLKGLHNKWEFGQRARRYGLRVPDAHWLTSPDEAQALWRAGGEWVFKPVYSRFAAHTVVRPQTARDVARVTPTAQRPWIAQAYIAGRQICTYSIAHAGRIVAHAAYPTEFAAGQGATIVFRAIEHPAAQAWVETLVAAEGFTGQIAFDFIETPGGDLFALECNPRATSGLHLLADHPDLPRAFYDAAMPCITPRGDQTALLATALLTYGLASVRSWADLRRWARTLLTGRDVIWDARDPLPALLQWIGMAQFLWWSLSHHSSALEASTWDIEWNGE